MFSAPNVLAMRCSCLLHELSSAHGDYELQELITSYVVARACSASVSYGVWEWSVGVEVEVRMGVRARSTRTGAVMGAGEGLGLAGTEKAREGQDWR